MSELSQAKRVFCNVYRKIRVVIIPEARRLKEGYEL